MSSYSPNASFKNGWWLCCLQRTMVIRVPIMYVNKILGSGKIHAYSNHLHESIPNRIMPNFPKTVILKTHENVHLRTECNFHFKHVLLHYIQIQIQEGIDWYLLLYTAEVTVNPRTQFFIVKQIWNKMDISNFKRDRNLFIIKWNKYAFVVQKNEYTG
jgi:hypothetical protein